MIAVTPTRETLWAELVAAMKTAYPCWSSSGEAVESCFPRRSTDTVRTWLIFTQKRFGRSGLASSGMIHLHTGDGSAPQAPSRGHLPGGPRVEAHELEPDAGVRVDRGWQKLPDHAVFTLPGTVDLAPRGSSARTSP